MKSRIDEQTDKREWRCRVRPKGINFHSLSEKVRQNKCNLKFLNDKLAWHKPSVEKLFLILWIKTEKVFFFWGVCILPNGTFCWDFRSAKLLSVILVQEQKSICPTAKFGHSHVDRYQHQRQSDLCRSHLLHDLDARIRPKSIWFGHQDPTRIQGKSVIDESSTRTLAQQNVTFLFSLLSLISSKMKCFLCLELIKN